MYTNLATWYPLPGKEAEMLAGGVAFVTEHQARGEDYALFARLYSPIGPAITVVRRFRDLAEAEAARDQNQADPAFQAASAKASALCRAPFTSRLREEIVPVNATGEVKFVQSTAVYPALGNISQVRTLLAEWVKGEQAKRGIGMAVDLYDPDGTFFVVIGVYPSLSAVEEARHANMADKAFQEAASEVSRLCRRLAAATLAAVVVRFRQ